MHPRLRGTALTVGAATVVVAVVAGVLTILALRQVSRHANADDLRSEALAAGRQIAVDFAAYDYRHLAADFKRVADESTGKFHQEYVTQSAGLHDLIVKAKAVSTAEVAGAGVMDSSARSATVLVALNRTIRNKDVPRGQNDSLGVQITLVHQGDRWLASQVKPL